MKQNDFNKEAAIGFALGVPKALKAAGAWAKGARMADKANTAMIGLSVASLASSAIPRGKRVGTAVADAGITQAPLRRVNDGIYNDTYQIPKTASRFSLHGASPAEKDEIGAFRYLPAAAALAATGLYVAHARKSGDWAAPAASMWEGAKAGVPKMVGQALRRLGTIPRVAAKVVQTAVKGSTAQNKNIFHAWLRATGQSTKTQMTKTSFKDAHEWFVNLKKTNAAGAKRILSAVQVNGDQAIFKAWKEATGVNQDRVLTDSQAKEAFEWFEQQSQADPGFAAKIGLAAPIGGARKYLPDAPSMTKRVGEGAAFGLGAMGVHMAADEFFKRRDKDEYRRLSREAFIDFPFSAKTKANVATGNIGKIIDQTYKTPQQRWLDGEGPIKAAHLRVAMFTKQGAPEAVYAAIGMAKEALDVRLIQRDLGKLADPSIRQRMLNQATRAQHSLAIRGGVAGRRLSKRMHPMQ